MSIFLAAFGPIILTWLGIALCYFIYEMNQCFDRIEHDLTEAIESCLDLQIALRGLRVL